MATKTKKRKAPFDNSKKNGANVVEHKLTISSLTIIKIVAILVGIFFLWVIRDVIGILFIALVLASALDPWVDRLERFRVPRGVSILGVYFVMIIVLSFIVYLIIPPIIIELSEIGNTLKEYSPKIDSLYRYITQSTDASISSQIQSNLLNLNSTLTNLTSGIFGAVTGFIGKIVMLVFVLVITFYMTIEEDGIKKFIRSIAPIQYQPYLVQKINRIQMKMGMWLRGQLILMMIIGALAFIGLYALGVPYALVLALLAGLVEFIPYIGPVMAAIPAVFFAFTDSPWKAIGVIILYIVIQQLENQVIVPKLMQKAVGLNPIVVIAAMLIGAKTAGFVGILLAVPAATILWIFVEDIFEQKRAQDNKLEEPVSEE